MKIFIKAPGEDWIIDRYKREWQQYRPELFTDELGSCDILWLMDTYTWNTIDPIILRNKKVVNTIHHIAPDKFDFDGFKEKDQYVDHYHAVSLKTADALSKSTSKPITPLTFWVNDNIWFESEHHVDDLRKKHDLPLGKILVGSFQRDTEGHDLKSPKLVKGPDLFCNYMEQMKDNLGTNFDVVLSGWRRQYVMDRLSRAGIRYHYFELCDFETLNELYNSIDLYVVSSRVEGGPQAIPECSMTRTPIISRDVGLAPEILAPESVNDDLNAATPNLEYAYDKVQQYTIKNHMQKFVDLFIDI